MERADRERVIDYMRLAFIRGYYAAKRDCAHRTYTQPKCETCGGLGELPPKDDDVLHPEPCPDCVQPKGPK
jgi:hypothetical protein